MRKNIFDLIRHAIVSTVYSHGISFMLTVFLYRLYEWWALIQIKEQRKNYVDANPLTGVAVWHHSYIKLLTGVPMKCMHRPQFRIKALRRFCHHNHFEYPFHFNVIHFRLCCFSALSTEQLLDREIQSCVDLWDRGNEMDRSIRIQHWQPDILKVGIAAGAFVSSA